MTIEETRFKNNERIILRNQLPALTGYSIVHRYRLIKAKRMPAPVRLGDNRVGWLESELRQWLDNKIAARDALLNTGSHTHG